MLFRSLRLVARHAAGWNVVWKATPEWHAERAAALRQAAEEVGRDPSTVRLSVGLYTLVGEDEADVERRYRALQAWTPGGALDGTSLEEFARDTLTGTVEHCVERLRAFAEGGVEEFVACAGPVPFSVYDWEAVDLIGERLLPEAHALAA